MENTPSLLSLPALAKYLNLPEDWLKAEALGGRIPHLQIGNRFRFNLDAVIRTLADLAANSVGKSWPACPTKRQDEMPRGRRQGARQDRQADRGDSVQPLNQQIMKVSNAIGARP